MIPAAFDYERATSVDDAVGRLARLGEDAKLLAGGHSLLPLMKLRLAAPSVLVDIGRLPELSYVREDNGHVTIGALTRHRDLEISDVLQSRAAPLPCGRPGRRPTGASSRHHWWLPRPR
jgi:carbon-monoxide dehydrogenase medium subunit